MATLATVGQPSRLFIYDRRSHTKFLVDTGSEVSILPRKSVKNNRFSHNEWSLYAANGSSIKTFGQQLRQLDFGLGRNYSWFFIVADVTMPIIGADFLAEFHLTPNLAERKLEDRRTKQAVPCTLHPHSQSSISTINKDCPIKDLLSHFPGITRPVIAKEVKHNVRHYIKTTGAPVHAKSRPLNPEKRKAAKAEFQLMESQGIVRVSHSRWSSPLHMVKKGLLDWRPVGDYRALNSVTVPDKYPVPRLHDFTAYLDGCKVFSSVDLIRGFHQIPMADEDVEKTAVITPFGLYEYLRMPFGLRNAPQTFQRFMNQVVRDLDFTFVYIDDILIASETEAEHRRHLETLFQRLSDYGLNINTSKCRFVQTDLKFLGHLINENGFKPLPEKVSAIREFPKPETKKQLRRFLGMSNFYRCFQRGIAATLKPLYDLIKMTPERQKLKWTDETNIAFASTIQSLADMTQLHYYRPGAAMSLQTDASNSAIGAVIQQQVNGHWQPLGYFSRALKPPEIKYSTFDRELLAVYRALKHFSYMLMDKTFIVFTDHKPLVHALGSTSEKTPRQTTHLSYLSEFNVEIRHVKGEDNVVADALSRFNVDAIQSTLWSMDELAEAQKVDPELNTDLANARGLKPITIGGKTIIAEVKDGNRIRYFVPEPLRKRCFDSYHTLMHDGSKSSKKRISQEYFWPNMNKDIARWAKNCLRCQGSKPGKHAKVPPTPIDVPDSRFSHVHLDLVGPWSPVEGYTNILTMVDRTSRWLEAVPVKDITAQTVADAFLANWISRFGVPNTITTDRGTQFESSLFNNLNQKLGSNRIATSAFNPRANGLVERQHLTLKSALIAKSHEGSWLRNLPFVLLGMRTAHKVDLKTSSAEMLYGQELKLPASISPDPGNSEKLLEQMRNFSENIKARPTRVAEPSEPLIPKALQTCTHVMVRIDSVRKPLDPRYHGPYPIIKRNRYTYSIKTPNGDEDISISRLKAAHSDEESPAPVFKPNPRGRPPKQKA